MKTIPNCRKVLICAAIGCALSSELHAVVITNGGFESGLSGWTTANQAGSEGSFVVQNGTASPANGNPVPAPPGGLAAAMTDAQGPGSHVLYQSFTAAAPVASAQLVFDLFVGNRSDRFVTPNSLDFATPALNQQARVDILAGGADPFSLAAADVLMNAYRTNVGDPLISGYTHFSVDITSLLNNNLNTPLMIRFAETDNVFTMQLGVDNVDIVPEPASASLLGLAVLGWLRRRRAVPIA